MVPLLDDREVLKGEASIFLILTRSTDRCLLPSIMSQPISLPGASQSNGYQYSQSHSRSFSSSQQSTSPADQFSPPKHFYPVALSPGAAGFSNGQRHGFVSRVKPSIAAGTDGSLPRSASSASGSASSKSPRARSMSAAVQPKVLTPFVPKILEDAEEKVQPKLLLLESVCSILFHQKGLEKTELAISDQ